ncbi:MAG: PfkB family carbohydrate kinase [Candidatus Pacearchaeota archaeon]
MITVVGGTYEEHCFEPRWKENFGSGLRACWAINKLNAQEPTRFYTFADTKMKIYLTFLSQLSTKFFTTPIDTTIKFYYDHPLISPRIYPRPDLIEKQKNSLPFIEDENILYYGLIEGTAKVSGKKVVYDPQSPVNPKLFSSTGSYAEKLVYVVNYTEASRLSSKTSLEEIIDFFFTTENVYALVLKMNAKGAIVIDNDRKHHTIPVYQTASVWPIGSGDIFAAVFAHDWFTTDNLVLSAKNASWQTACYCNSRDFQFTEIGVNDEIKELNVQDIPKAQVYLAGPFFTFSERWLIDQIRDALLGFRLKVFSPWHDVGHGVASDVVPKDLEALENSGIVFAVVDGLDSGTLFEIGYAVKMGIPVIAYVENETSDSIKMLEGTNCILEKDLSTAIYKCFWKLI